MSKLPRDISSSSLRYLRYLKQPDPQDINEAISNDFDEQKIIEPLNKTFVIKSPFDPQQRHKEEEGQENLHKNKRTNSKRSHEDSIMNEEGLCFNVNTDNSFNSSSEASPKTSSYNMSSFSNINFDVFQPPSLISPILSLQESAFSNDFFKSPPPKKKIHHVEDSIKSSGTSNEHFPSSFFNLFDSKKDENVHRNKSHPSLATEVLFGDGSIPSTRETESLSGFFRIINKETNKAPSELTLDESFLPKKCRNGNLETTLMQREKLNVSTAYKTRYILKTNQCLIENFYKVLKISDWNAVASNMIELMEPNFDYLHSHLNFQKHVSVGRVDQEIEYEDCDNIQESLKEIKKSFQSPSFISSTPNNSFNALTSKISSSPKVDSKVDSFLESFERTAGENVSDYNLLLNNSMIMLSNIDIQEEVPRNKSSETQNAIEGFTNESQNSPIPDLDEIKTKLDQEEFSQKNPIITEARKAGILNQIEEINLQLLEAMTQQKPIVLKVRKIKSWHDCTMSNDVLSPKETNIEMKSISFGNKLSEKTFTIVTVVLCEIYKMLQRNLTCTKREIYYRDVELFKSQVNVNKALDTICSMLNVQEFELGIFSSSKGLVAGDLKVIIENETFDCSTTTQMIPQNPSAIKNFETNANYVLIVEKDTVFQRLISDNIFERIEDRIILITAKGYPDVNTRIFLKKMSSILKLPMYIIVDADPHGFEIMCTYKFGSMMKVRNSEQLAVPSIEWIGIHPSDIEGQDIVKCCLSEADLKKVDELLQRPYINCLMQRELGCFKSRKLKAEIENIYGFSIDFFVNDYIPRKIRLASNFISL